MITKARILELRTEGKSYREISKILDCTKSTISYYVGVKRGPNGVLPPKYCKHCNEKIGASQVFCDSLCNSAYKKYLRVERLKKGEIHWNSSIRPALIGLFGNKCTLCLGTDIWNGQRLTLHVDHIDGNSDNNILTNLRLLCPNCHSQLATSKGSPGVKKDTRRNSYLRKYKGYKQD